MCILKTTFWKEEIGWNETNELEHTYTYIYNIHTYIHTYIHKYKAILMVRKKTQCKFMHIHTCIHTYTHTYTRTYIHTHMHTYFPTTTPYLRRFRSPDNNYTDTGQYDRSIAHFFFFGSKVSSQNSAHILEEEVGLDDMTIRINPSDNGNLI